MVWYFCSGRHVFLLLTFFARNSLEAMNKILKPEYESRVCNAGNGRTCPRNMELAKLQSSFYRFQLRCIFVFLFFASISQEPQNYPWKKIPTKYPRKKKIETTKHSQKKVAKHSLSLPNTKTIIQKQTKTIIE